MTEQETKQAVSATLLEAQARLLSRRAQRPSTSAYSCASNSRENEISQRTTGGCDLQIAAGLPSHLGWGSSRQSEQMRKALANRGRNLEAAAGSDSDWIKKLASFHPPTLGQSAAAPSQHSQPAPLGTQKDQCALPSEAKVAGGYVKLQPSIGLGIIRSKLAAPGRIWLLLRWLDTSGSGWIDAGYARRLLCTQESPVKVCGWRHLRSLLAKGEGRFWNQREGRIWLRSIPKVAQSLKIRRLSGHPVHLPVETLLQNIGQVRAHLYASFHSGRKHANPISRASLRRISHVCPRSQRNYDLKTKTKKQKNYAIGSKLTAGDVQNQGWEHGSACFKWHGHKARLGQSQNDRLAWQLPNSYTGPHARQPRGRQRQINRQLAVLFNQGITGNDHITDDWFSKRYFNDAAEAVRTLNHARSGIYWQSEHRGRWFYWDSRGGS